jgi:hypothetical protein
VKRFGFTYRQVTLILISFVRSFVDASLLGIAMLDRPL